jgi:hypothetical protein
VLVTTEETPEEGGCCLAILLLAPVSQACRTGHAMLADEVGIDIDDCETRQSRGDEGKR